MMKFLTNNVEIVLLGAGVLSELLIIALFFYGLENVF